MARARRPSAIRLSSAVFLVLAFCSAAFAASCNPAGLSCGCTADSPNTLYLVTVPQGSEGTCVAITADNVTIDCQGNSLIGSGPGYALVSNRDNLTVRNCVISNYDRGIYAGAGRGVRIENNTLSGVVSGIIVCGGASGAVSGNSVTANSLIANFSSVLRAAYGPDGSLYVADSGGHTIKKIDLATNQTSLVAGNGTGSYAEGVGAAASFNFPDTVAYGPDGALYVADTSNHRIRKINLTTNQTSLVAGNGTGSYAEGVGAAASFKSPYGLAFAPDGSLYVADTLNHRIRKINLATNQTSLVAGSGGSGYAEGVGAAASFRAPRGAAYGPDGALYVADSNNHRIRKIDLATNQTSLVAGNGTGSYAEGVGAAASFKYPYGIAAAPDGSLYVADAENQLVRKISLATNQTSVVAGSGASAYAEGVGAAASFNHPYGAAFGTDGALYVADVNNNLIRKINLTTNQTSRVAGRPSPYGSAAGYAYAEGVGASAGFYRPFGAAYAPDGALYVADFNVNRIRKVNLTTNQTFLVAGSGGLGYAEGAGAAATFSGPFGLAYGPDGSLYVADSNNERIRKIDLATGATSLVVGNGDTAYAEGVGAAAGLRAVGLAFAPDGSLYFSDYVNNRIRKVNLTTNQTSLVAGNGNASYAEGVGAAASFSSPSGLAFGADGSLYVADRANCRIRKVNITTNQTSLVAGDGNASYAEGVGAAASFKSPHGIAAAPDGSIYVTDFMNYRVRKIDLATNQTSLVAGSGAYDYAEGVGAAASFRGAYGIAFAPDGSLYVPDTNNHRIRKINLATNQTSLVAGSGNTGGPEYVALKMDSASSCSVGNNTLRSTYGPALNSTNSSSNSYVNNTLFSDAYGLAVLDSGSSGNTFLWNNFTATAGMYALDAAGTNAYSAATAYGTTEGNAWANVLSGAVQINGTERSGVFPSLYIGSGGSGYPYSSATSGGKVSAGVEDGSPLTPAGADAAPPAVALGSPANASHLNSSACAFSFTALENIHGAMNCSLFLDGSLNRSNGSIANGTAASFPVAGLQDGGHTWFVRCTDRLNNSGTSETRNFTVDTAAPVVTLLAPASLATFSSSPVNMSFVAVDNLSAAMNCSLFLDGAPNALPSVPNGTAAYFAADMPMGQHNWSVDCTDAAGNTGSSETRPLSMLPPSGQQPRAECAADSDCPGSEACPGGSCVAVPCPCGTVADHQCVANACCADSDCAVNEACGSGSCVAVQCACGTILAHRCIPYACCVDSDCGEGSICSHNACVPAFGCAYDSQCPAGRYCDLSAGLAGGTCRESPAGNGSQGQNATGPAGQSGAAASAIADAGDAIRAARAAGKNTAAAESALRAAEAAYEAGDYARSAELARQAKLLAAAAAAPAAAAGSSALVQGNSAAGGIPWEAVLPAAAIALVGAWLLLSGMKKGK